MDAVRDDLGVGLGSEHVADVACSSARSSSWFSMMPLCTTARPSRETCGWALRSLGSPCVAQRVCAMPSWPRSRLACQRLDQRAHLADGAHARHLARLRSAPPCPRSRSRGTRAACSPSTRTGTMSRPAIAANDSAHSGVELAPRLKSAHANFWPSSSAASSLRWSSACCASSVSCAGRRIALVMVEPAPMVAPAPIVTGATSIVPEPMKAPSPMSRPQLVHAVVVAGDGAGADVDVARRRRVADVGQVIDLAAAADACCS